jgi:hypothetical protein
MATTIKTYNYGCIAVDPATRERWYDGNLIAGPFEFRSDAEAERSRLQDSADYDSVAVDVLVIEIEGTRTIADSEFADDSDASPDRPAEALGAGTFASRVADYQNAEAEHITSAQLDAVYAAYEAVKAEAASPAAKLIAERARLVETLEDAAADIEQAAGMLARAVPGSVHYASAAQRYAQDAHADAQRQYSAARLALVKFDIRNPAHAIYGLLVEAHAAARDAVSAAIKVHYYGPAGNEAATGPAIVNAQAHAERALSAMRSFDTANPAASVAYFHIAAIKRDAELHVNPDWTRYTAAEQRNIFGAYIFGRRAIRLTATGIDVYRRVAYGADYNISAFTFAEIADLVTGKRSYTDRD